jgi:hypothetical protein
MIVCRILVSAIIAASCVPNASALQQAPVANSGDLDHIIGTLNFWVMTLAIFVTVVIAASAFNVVNQYYQAGKFGERVKADLVAQMEKELSVLKETYKLVELKPPAEIIKEAQSDYMPLLENLRAAAQRQYIELNSTMNKAHSDLAASIEFNRKLIDDLRGTKIEVPDAQAPVGAGSGDGKPAMTV